MNTRKPRCMKAYPVRQLLAAGGFCLLLAPCAFSANFLWSPASNLISVGNGGSATLSDIKAVLPAAPLDLVDAASKIWLLRANLVVQDGCTLSLHGGTVGGDVNELRIQSVNSASPCGCVVSITADWGALDINSTKVTSWDTIAGGPQTNYLSSGRAFICVRSSLSTNGVTPLESRMNITNSEICFLGTAASDSYGLVWTASGADPDPASSIFYGLRVYGNVVNCRLHDNYIGGYTLGAANMQWLNNQIWQNAQYGLNLQEDSGGFLIQGNNFSNNGAGPVQVADSDANTFAANTFGDLTGKLRFKNSVSNVLDGNTISAGMSVRTEGDTNALASTYVRNQPYLNVELGANAMTIFEDAQGKIYQPDETSVLTEITAFQSTLSLTAANVGSSSTIVARKLWGSASPGAAVVNRVVWTNPNSKKWTVTAGSIGQELTFVVGDLDANSAYRVHKAGLLLVSLNSDSSGQLRFSDTASSTSAVLYSVDLAPANAPVIVLPSQATTANMLSIRWFVPSGGWVLQQTATLNPPIWVDVATNSLVAAWENDVIGPFSNRSGFFRLKQTSP